MAVQLSFEVCQSLDCRSLVFTETTGEYSSSNITGWGSPNKLTSDAETAVLIVTTPSGADYTFNLFTESPAFPTSDDEREFVIDTTDIGGTTGSRIPNGLYLFRYSVTRTTATAFSYSQQIQQLFYCTARCCVNSMFADLDFECDCCEEEIDRALKAKAMLYSLELAAGAGHIDKFNNLLDILTKLCNNTNCNSCN